MASARSWLELQFRIALWAHRESRVAPRRFHGSTISNLEEFGERVDLIIVLYGAKLVEAGYHEELMAKQGPYSELYAMQAAAYR